jgi:hypothetical protein
MAQRQRWQGSGSLQLRVAQVLVDGLPADPVAPGQDGFRDTAAGALGRLSRPFGCEGLFPSFVGAALLGQGDAFSPAFPDEGAFEFGEGTHDGEHEVGHGGVLPSEDQAPWWPANRSEGGGAWAYVKEAHHNAQRPIGPAHTDQGSMPTAHPAPLSNHKQDCARMVI